LQPVFRGIVRQVGSEDFFAPSLAAVGSGGDETVFPDASSKSIKHSRAIGNTYLINKNYQIYESIVLAYDSLRSLDCSTIPKE
jgi:hypothetical protein